MTPDTPDKAVPTDEELRRLCENWLEDEAVAVAVDLEMRGQPTLATAIREGRTMARALLSRLSAGADAGVETAGRAMDALDGLADAWAAEVNLNAMLDNVVSPMRLDPSAPQSVRDDFAKRMKEQAYAIVVQAFVEGSYRARLKIVNGASSRPAS